MGGRVAAGDGAGVAVDVAAASGVAAVGDDISRTAVAGGAGAAGRAHPPPNNSSNANIEAVLRIGETLRVSAS